MVFTPETRAQIKEVERHWKSNLIIRSVILVLDIINCFIFGFVSLPRDILWYEYIALGPSAIWTLAVIITRLSRVAVIHPGVHVGFELTLWLAFLVVQVFAYLATIEFAPWSAYQHYYFPSVTGSVWALVMYACLALSVLTVLHFYLFVHACINTSRARSHEIATRAAGIAAQMMKNMESRGTFFRRDSDASYGFIPFEASEAGHIIGLQELHNNTGLAPLQSSARSHISHTRSTRTGRTLFSEGGRTQYSHTRSLSVPVPTSPMSLRTAKTDEPSLFRLAR